MRRLPHWASRTVVLVSVALVTGLVLTGCGGQMDILDPAGTGAREVSRLWWLLFGMGTVVFVVVLLLIVVAIVRRPAETHPGDPLPARFVLTGGAIVPLVILSVVFGATLWTLTSIADLAEDDAMTVHVIGHQFWWEVRYPDLGIVTANEIHVPVGQPVRFTLTGEDVIHSLWVPELSGKMDLIPGRTNTLWIEAEEAGTYRGQCAEFCGAQHANMAFLVVAQEDDAFQGWVENQQLASVEPDSEVLIRGQQVFLSAACVYCHRVEGTAAQGQLGPDLTHLASRETLAAGTLENNRGNLAGWITNPQAIKPGNQMPGITFSSEDLQYLLSYLESLE